LLLAHVIVLSRIEIVESETVWRALASPHRRRLLDLLREGPRSTGQLTKELSGLSRFGVMQHLSVLEEAGLVLFRRDGRQRFNYANPVPLREMYERWVEPVASTAAETALHLKRYAEGKSNNREVSDSMEGNDYRHVKIELEMRINAPRERVYRALTEELGNWWPHRYKPDSEVFCEVRVGGMIGERFKNGGGARYGTIVYLDPPYKLASSGPSSLNQGQNSFSSDTLEEEGESTMIKRSMQIWGSVPPDLEKMYREGIQAIVEDALNAYVVKGVRYSAEGKEEWK
jgi:DNA-binding transcriptional ArsR family regulator